MIETILDEFEESEIAYIISSDVGKYTTVSAFDYEGRRYRVEAENVYFALCLMKDKLCAEGLLK